MVQASKTFRIFVSSTFSDLKAERNALQERVFPRLRELCQQHGSRFQPIDLRWGVSDEASLDQQAMNICLGEIERCQQASPRPNFIVLLGDRYGWCPPPSQIPAKSFEEILRVIEIDEDAALLKEWYSLDENAVPPEWRLKPRQRGSPYEGYTSWQPVESRLHAILAAAVQELPLTDDERLPYTASATEQEIAAGALRVQEAPEHVLCFFRRIDGLPHSFSSRDFLTTVTARLEQEYPGDLRKSNRDLLNAILDMGPSSSARDVADRIQKSLEHTPKATPEEEALKFLQQTLVDFTARDFQNLDEKGWTVDEAAQTNQNRLKERLGAHVPGNTFTYQAHWTGSGITTDHIDQLCMDVYSSLSRIILGVIDHPHEIIRAGRDMVHLQPDDGLDEEGFAHRKFAEERLRFFVGRREMLANIAAHLQTSSRIQGITGAGGTGKSALVAKAIQQTQESHPTAEIVYRFIGATPASSDGRSLLDSLCREITRRYGADGAGIPTDYRDLVPELGKRMKLATAGRPLILFLDSLDQLSASQDARRLTWLPNELPEHVSVIVSTRPEDTLDALRAKGIREEELGGLSREEGSHLVSQWLASVHRTLQPAQLKEVLDKFEQSQGNPLYLKLAFEEARLWVSGSGKPPELLASGVSGIIEKNTIDRLKNEANHGPLLVSRALGYLAASRYGLAEDELIDLLSRDLQVYEWFFQKSYHLPADLVKWAIQYRRSHPNEPVQGDGQPREGDERVALAWLREIRTPPEKVSAFLMEVLPKADGPRLPVVLWSRLSFDLAPYLTVRLVDGSSLLTFYHRELGDVSSAVFLTHGKALLYHERLADYFRFKADPAGDRSWTGKNIHGLSELPYHLTAAARYDDLYQTLTDFNFLEHKAAEVGVLERGEANGHPVKTYTGVLHLQDDFGRALDAIPEAGESGSASPSSRPPLIVTAVDSGGGPALTCPVCQVQFLVQRDWLGNEIHCQNPHCLAPLRLNAFVVRASQPSPSRGSAEKKDSDAKPPAEEQKKRWQFWKK